MHQPGYRKKKKTPRRKTSDIMAAKRFALDATLNFFTLLRLWTESVVEQTRSQAANTATNTCVLIPLWLVHVITSGRYQVVQVLPKRHSRRRQPMQPSLTFSRLTGLKTNVLVKHMDRVKQHQDGSRNLLGFSRPRSKTVEAIRRQDGTGTTHRFSGINMHYCTAVA